MSSAKQEAKKIFIVNRDRKTPNMQQESNLLCNEDLDENLISNTNNKDIYTGSRAYVGAVNPESIGIPSDVSRLDRAKDEVSSNVRTEEGFDEFMRWGNKFAFDSSQNSPKQADTTIKDHMSFTFTERDQRSPDKDISNTHTEESKIDHLDIEEWSPEEFPSVKVPKRFVTSCAGVIFEK